MVLGYFRRIPWALGGKARRTDSIPSSSVSCVIKMQRDSRGQLGGGGVNPGAMTTFEARSTCLLCVKTPATALGPCTGDKEEVIDLRGSGKEGWESVTLWHGLLPLLCLCVLSEHTVKPPKTLEKTLMNLTLQHPDDSDSGFFICGSVVASEDLLCSSRPLPFCRGARPGRDGGAPADVYA